MTGNNTADSWNAGLAAAKAYKRMWGVGPINLGGGPHGSKVRGDAETEAWEAFQPTLEHRGLNERDMASARQNFMHAYYQEMNKGTYQERNPSTSDMEDLAFEAGKEWGQTGSWSSGVSNANVRRYGFVKWWNNTLTPATERQVRKSAVERAFNEGYKIGREKANQGFRERAKGRRNPDFEASDYATPKYSVYTDENTYHGYAESAQEALSVVEGLLGRGFSPVVKVITREGPHPISLERLRERVKGRRNPDGDMTGDVVEYQIDGGPVTHSTVIHHGPGYVRTRADNHVPLGDVGRVWAKAAYVRIFGKVPEGPIAGRRNPDGPDGEPSYLDVYTLGVAAGEKYKEAVMSLGLTEPTYGTVQAMYAEADEPGLGVKYAGGADGFDAFRDGFREGYMTKGYVTRTPPDWGRKENPEGRAKVYVEIAQTSGAPPVSAGTMFVSNMALFKSALKGSNARLEHTGGPKEGRGSVWTMTTRGRLNEDAVNELFYLEKIGVVSGSDRESNPYLLEGGYAVRRRYDDGSEDYYPRSGYTSKEEAEKQIQKWKDSPYHDPRVSMSVVKFDDYELEGGKWKERQSNPMSPKSKQGALKALRAMGVYKPDISVSPDGQSIVIESYPLEAKILAGFDPNEGPIHTYRIVNVHGGETLTSGVVTIGQDLMRRVGQALIDFHGPAFEAAKAKEAETMRRIKGGSGEQSNPESSDGTPDIYRTPVTIGGKRVTIFSSGVSSRQQANIVNRLFPDHSGDKQWHARKAQEFVDLKNRAVDNHSSLWESSFRETFGRAPEPYDFRISGIGSDKLPADVKDRLRDLSRVAGAASEIAGAHAAAAGVKYHHGGHYLAHSSLGSKRNPESSAADLYESFHGKPSEELLEIGEEVHYHENLAGLGTLTEIKVDCFSGYSAELKFDRDTQLCSNEEGTQLYIVGGDQSLDLKALKFKDDEIAKDQVAIGVITEITYNTQKGFHNFKPTDYYHELGEESGYQPILTYDARSQLLTIAGGAYKIKPEGIVN